MHSTKYYRLLNLANCFFLFQVVLSNFLTFVLLIWYLKVSSRCPWQDFSLRRNTCYYVSDSLETSSQAASICQSKNGRLAVVSTNETLKNVQELAVEKNTKFIVGLNKMVCTTLLNPFFPFQLLVALKDNPYTHWPTDGNVLILMFNVC